MAMKMTKIKVLLNLHIDVGYSKQEIINKEMILLAGKSFNTCFDLFG
jgi:hypothetical protein